MKRHRFPVWTVLAAVLVAALVIGSGVLSSKPLTTAQRAYAIESVLRCPSCQDLSVAESTAPTAVAVRTTVSRLLSQGRTDQQIETYLEDRYGSSILLDPPARGWPLTVWLVPIVGGAAAVAVLGVFLFRRRGHATLGVPPEASTSGDAATRDAATGGAVTGGAATGKGLEGLEDRRRFLERSLADADAEYLAGDLAEEDYLFLRRRDLVRLAAVEEELDAATPEKLVRVAAAPPESEPVAGVARVAAGTAPTSEPAVVETGPDAPAVTNRGGTQRRWLVRGAVASFAAALVLSLSLFTANRLPGQTATGTVSMTEPQRIAQSLDQAAKLENDGQLGQAASLYQSVLAGHPDNEVALAQLGWLEYQIGRSGNSSSLMDDGETKLARATRLNGGDYAASLYLGTVLLQRDGNAAAAIGQYERFLADSPPVALVKQAAPELRQAYAEAGVALPPEVPS